MKRLFRIFELTRNEQRVVLIVMFALIAIAFVGYERRAHHVHVQPPMAPDMIASPTPIPTHEAQ
jgi:hypothetical protein